MFLKSNKRLVSKEYDVAVIDLGLPGMAGHLVAEQIKKLDPNVVTVLITGWELPNNDDRLKPFDFTVQKPINLDPFEDTIARAVHLHDKRG